MPGGVGGQRCEPLPTRLVKKTIKAGKVQRTGILQISGAYISVLCTFCMRWILFTTNINGALHLKSACIILPIQNVIEPDLM